MRSGPWRGDRRVAYLAPLPDAPPPSVDAVRRSVDGLVARGYVEVVTTALGPGEQAGFLAAGFTMRERLHLLAHDLDDLPRADAGSLRRARRRDRGAVLATDGHAFPEFWQLDDRGLDDALSATPASRFRVAADPDVVAYAISGRAGTRGYLQRLAVAPEHQGRGLGRALAVDGLRWMRRRGVRRAVVNTQHGNDAAVGLYERLGFRRQPAGLAVLGLRVSSDPATAARAQG